MSLVGLRVTLVGPLPPPEGGMANQTRQLAELLEREGAVVTVVRTNTPYWPSWIARRRFLREAFRIVPYVVRLWRDSGNADVFHVMANSGWAWHLCAAPAILIARIRGVPAIVNYHGGGVETFLERSGGVFLKTLAVASALAVPSDFLKQVFASRGVGSDIVPNVIDLEHFRPGGVPAVDPHFVVARSLEPIYDIPTALRAFALVRKEVLPAKLTVAGAGPDENALRRLASDLGISDAVHFCGRLDRDRMADLYRSALVVLNPSRVDNMPGSVLEAMASGVPVVSTNVGGVPFIVRDGATALLVDPGDHAAMATAGLRLLRNPGYAAQIRDAALREAQQYAWQRVRHRWASIYDAARTGARVEIKAA